jgi:hypothetical protein
MMSTKLKVASLFFAAFGIAALLGGTLGVATAGTKPSLFAGTNPAVGGPLAAAVTPDKWVSCLPSSSWRAVYRWDGTAQSWSHYFNTAKGIPDYVNDTDVGGIDLIPRLSGLAMQMDELVNNPFMPDSPTQSCP